MASQKSIELRQQAKIVLESHRSSGSGSLHDDLRYQTFIFRMNQRTGLSEREITTRVKAMASGVYFSMYGESA